LESHFPKEIKTFLVFLFGHTIDYNRGDTTQLVNRLRLSHGIGETRENCL